MANDNTMKICIAVGVIFLIGIIMWFCMKKKNETYVRDVPAKEEFTSLSAGSFDNVGILDDESYDLTQGAGDNIPAAHFADMVQQRDNVEGYASEKKMAKEAGGFARLGELAESSLLPKAASTVPYALFAANPNTSLYSVNAPRVVLKSNNYEMDMSNAIRGTNFVAFHPDVCVIDKSRYGPEDSTTGLFTDTFAAAHNKYTGKEFKNLVTKIAGAGVASCGGGMQNSVIMDSN